MKKCGKILAAVLVLAMALTAGSGAAWAAEEDFEPIVLVDNDDIAMTVTEYDPAGQWGPSFKVLLENKTSRNLQFSLSDVSVDEVMCEPYWGQQVAAGKKAYGEISWYEEDLAAVGVNYIAQVEGTLWVYDTDDFAAEDIYYDTVSWTVPGGEGPAWEDVSFDHGFEPVELVSGDVDVSVVDFDPDEDYGPAMVIRVENHTDKTVWVEADDVSVNDFMCDPYWGQTVQPGKLAYSVCQWYQEDLDANQIDQMETVEFTIQVLDYADYTTMDSASAVIDLTGGASSAEETAPADEPAQQPEQPAEEPQTAPEDRDPVLGYIQGDEYINEYFGLSCKLDEGWSFYTDEELLQMQGLAADMVSQSSFAEYMDEMLDSNASLYVMGAYTDDGLQNMNVIVQYLSAMGGYLSEEDLLDIAFGEQGMNEEEFAAMGLEGINIERNTFELAGSEHSGALLTHTDSSLGIDIAVNQQMVLILEGDYYIQITMTSMFDDTGIPTMASFFSPLEES